MNAVTALWMIRGAVQKALAAGVTPALIRSTVEAALEELAV